MFGFFCSKAAISASAGLTACSLLATRNDSSTFSPGLATAVVIAAARRDPDGDCESHEHAGRLPRPDHVHPLSSCAPKTDGHRLATSRAIRAGENP